MSIKQNVENHPVVWFGGSVITAFVLGLSAYGAGQSFLGLEAVSKERVKAMEAERAGDASADPKLRQDLEDALRSISLLEAANLRLRDDLSAANVRISELTRQLGGAGSSSEELAALRKRLILLEAENAQLRGSAGIPPPQSPSPDPPTVPNLERFRLKFNEITVSPSPFPGYAQAPVSITITNTGTEALYVALNAPNKWPTLTTSGGHVFEARIDTVDGITRFQQSAAICPQVAETFVLLEPKASLVASMTFFTKSTGRDFTSIRRGTLTGSLIYKSARERDCKVVPLTGVDLPMTYSRQ